MRLILATAALVVLHTLAGCGPVTADYDSSFDPPAGTMVRVAHVDDVSRYKVAETMRAALERSLRDAGLLAPEGGLGPIVDLHVMIEDFEPGEALGGRYLRKIDATRLVVECTLRDGQRNAGTLTVHREVKGGVLTAAERESILSDAANDIVEELKDRLR